MGKAFIRITSAFSRPAAAQAGRYPASRHGGNYLFNFYFPPSPSSTAWAPTWAPDGRSVAVAMAGSIWRVALTSGAADELTYGTAYHSSPDWSPDGRWIVYTVDHDGGAVQLEILDVASGETHGLTDDDQIYADPVFSPDGTRLAYVATTPSGYFNVYIRPIADGRWNGDPVAVTRDYDFGRVSEPYGRGIPAGRRTPAGCSGSARPRASGHILSGSTGGPFASSRPPAAQTRTGCCRCSGAAPASGRGSGRSLR